MYGLGSRDALAKRQSRWVQDVDRDVRSGPAQGALSRDPPSNPIRDKPHIISVMADEDEQIHHVSDSRARVADEVMIELSTMKALCAELQQRCSELEQSYSSLRSSVGSDLVARITKLEETSGRLLSSLPDRDASIKSSISSESLRGISTPSIPEASRGGNSSDFSSLTEPDINARDTHEYIPYVINPDYAGQDNNTVLKRNHLTMTVEILNHYREKLVIYPFDTETRLPDFTPGKILLYFKDAENRTGTVNGSLRRRTDKVYIIDLQDFSTPLDQCTLPLVVTCSTNLLIE